MPIYEYVCKACGRETEIIHGVSEPSPKKCPACGKLKLSKLVSAAGFRLKGGGWYETDFKSGDKKNLVSDSSDSKPAASETAKPAPGKVASKAEPKPAAKADKKPPPGKKARDKS